VKPGLRELKKRRTRETILRVALELFAKQGYINTTLDQIAEAAEVSTGTLFAYFPSKEDILFPEEREFHDRLKQGLEQRPRDATTFDVLRDVLVTLESPNETFTLRLKILKDEGLRERLRARYMRVERLLADSIATDLGAAPGDLRSTVLAASAASALATVGERLRPEAGEAISYDEAITILDQMFHFLRSGLHEPQ
jgi:AcrR family transcriptional regulator